MAELIRSIPELKLRIRAWRRSGDAIGFVPTLGALHEGHLSLVRRAREACRRVVVSVFVNPTQFGPGEDLSRYPRTLDEDRRLCDPLADLVFAPSAAAMYPHPQEAWVEPGPQAAFLCGPFRPGHFRGVLTVVAKLFHLVEPDAAFFGAKDWQQAVLVRGMVRDLAFPLDVHVCPTVRDPDGLAMSSRNRYLSPAERRKALCLIRGLRAAEALSAGGERDPAVLKRAISESVTEVPEAIVDYIEVVDPETLQPARPGGAALGTLAVRLGATRLIDNLILVQP